MDTSALMNSVDELMKGGDESADLQKMDTLNGFQRDRRDQRRIREVQDRDDQRYHAIEDKLASTRAGDKVDTTPKDTDQDDMDNSIKYKCPEIHLHPERSQPQASQSQPVGPKGEKGDSGESKLSGLAKTAIATAIGTGLMGIGVSAYSLLTRPDSPPPQVIHQNGDTDTQTILEAAP